ncbi:MAG TPA: acyltransferase family protein [Solirubrobacteraceae bacterium]|nr:acyltransferase family protein [Solirubrobacteraceae bacterium]
MAGPDLDQLTGDADVPAEQPKPRSEIRPEIQALRAIAVLTVVVFHVWSPAMPGGFVGVDVFFAISGFLITAHLLREVDATGRIVLWGFWARRARRLLPAAMLTLVLCALGTMLFVPQVYWLQFLHEIGASTAYVQNWHLAADAVDYLNADNRPSPVQHFWSLSAEEQFYVVWPLLILLGAWTVRRRAAIAVVLTTVTGLSLAYSIGETASNPAAAYFVTPTRAWEFGAGGLLAMLGARAQLSDGARAALSWLGLAAIAYAAIFYTAQTAFPGSAALVPVLGALAVIHAGVPAAGWAPSRALRSPPLQFLGGISYSAYLWHWPLLVFAPFVLADADSTGVRLAIVAITVVVAWLTKTLVEDPVRRSRWLLSAPPGATFAFAGAATVVVGCILLAGTTHVQSQIENAVRATNATVKADPRCFGAASRDHLHPCFNPALRTSVVPLPVAAKAEDHAPCERLYLDGGISACDFGVAAKQATRTVALVGDSHASHWRIPLDAIAHARGWHGISVTRTSCPFSLATKLTPEPTRSNCVKWVKALPAYFRRHPEIDTVFVVGITGGKVLVPPGRTKAQAKIDGYRAAWRSLPPTVKHIVVIRDTPKIMRSTADCVDRAIAAKQPAGRLCTIPRALALGGDPEVAAARQEQALRLTQPDAAPARRVQVIDLTRVFCGKHLCYSVIGGALVFKDLHHFTLVFARTLTPQLSHEVDRVTSSW